MDAFFAGPGPVYRIVSPRLVIRCWQPKDAPLLKKAIDQSREHLKPWMPWAHDKPESVVKYAERLRKWRGMFDFGQDFVFGIFDRKETVVLGGTGLHTRVGDDAREIGYWIHKDHIGAGLATETVSALLKVAFEIESIHRVEIHCDPNNKRSSAVPKKLGFTLEAVLKDRQRFFDQWLDSMIWSIFVDQYPTSPASEIEIEAFNSTDRQIY